MCETKREGILEGIKNLKIPNDSKSKFLRNLLIIKEEGIALDELEDTPISAQVEALGWEKLVLKPSRINISVVYEFYYRIDSQKFMEAGVMVRGVRVPFNPGVINEYFGISIGEER